MDNTLLRSRTRLFPLGAIAVIAAISGCGGSGGSDSGSNASATELAFTVNWQQPAATRTSASVGDQGPRPLDFDTPIPPSVNAIRFIFGPESGSPCCIAVVRGSQAFEDRHIVLAAVSEGPSTLEVHGFPTDFAPADGTNDVCATRDGEGEPCTGDDTTLPSFGSDETPVDVIGGQTNVVNVDVYSLPFLIDLDPANGETVASNPPRVEFTVVDANFDIDPDVTIRLRNAPLTVNAEIVSSEPCRDNDAELPDCSEGGDLEVQGLHIVAQSPVNFPPGTAELRIRASNTAEPVREMESNTTFIVPGEITTTTTTVTTSTTVSTTTTSTTIDTTTTTLGGEEQTFCLRFSVANEVDLVGVSYTVSYTESGGDFVGSGENVECGTLLNANVTTTFASYNDDDGSALFTAIISGEPFSGPTDLALCKFRQVPPLDLNALAVQVTEATAPDLSSADATVVIEETPCSD